MAFSSQPKPQSKGQATTELLVSLAVLAPMFLLIPVVAHYLDIQTATHEASRYVAWERTAHATINQTALADQVQARFIDRESSGFSLASAGPVDERWRDYGSIGQSTLVDQDDDVAVTVNTLPVNLAGPVANANIGAIQALNPNALAATAVSIPLASEGSLLANFRAGPTYLQGERDPVPTPHDSVANKNRFHTSASAVLLAANNIVPTNASDYFNTTSSFVSTDGGRLRGWQAPLRLLNVVTLGFFDELDILQSGGDLEAIAPDQSVILPESVTQP